MASEFGTTFCISQCSNAWVLNMEIFCVGLDILSGLLLGWINTHSSISKCEPRLSVAMSAHVSYGIADLFDEDVSLF